jgi:Tfp pilus assembly protein FimT
MELLITGAILVLLAGISVPLVSSAVEAYRLRAAAWQLAGDLRLARQRAISRQKRHRLCFMNCVASVAANTYVFERDDGIAGAAQWAQDSAVPLNLPQGVSVDASQTSNPRGRIAFDVRGEGDAFGTLMVANRAGNYAITTDSIGRVLVCKGGCP